MSSTVAITDLAHFIQTSPLVDTHEHLVKEQPLLEMKPDILVDLFSNYVQADLAVAGASVEAVDLLKDSTNSEIRIFRRMAE